MKKLAALLFALAALVAAVQAAGCLDEGYKGLCVIAEKSFSRVDCDPYGRANEAIAAAASRYGVDASLVCAVIKKESSFNPRSVSPKGNLGYMQISEGLAAGCGLRGQARFEAAGNIDCGTKYLRTNLNRFGGLQLALAAYNAGPTAVRRAGNTVPNIRETTDYVSRVLAFYNTFSKQGNS